MPAAPIQRPAERKVSQKEIDKRKTEKYEQFLRDEEVQSRQRRENPDIPTPIDKYVLVEYVAVGRDADEPMVWNFRDAYADRWVKVTIGPNPPQNSPVALAPWQVVLPLCFIEGRIKGQPQAWRIVREIALTEFSEARLVPVQSIGVVVPPPKAEVDKQYDALPPDLGDFDQPSDLNTGPPQGLTTTIGDGPPPPGDGELPPDEVSTIDNAPVL
jgi:hypothetical protein